MNHLGIDAFHFVGLRGGSGGSGSYLLSLIEHLGRIVDLDVLASPRNQHLFAGLKRGGARITVRAPADNHAAAMRDLASRVDLIYAPFTNLPERETYARTPCVTAVHDLQHHVLKSFFPPEERAGRDDAYFNAVASADGVLTFAQAERDNIMNAYRPGVKVGVVAHAPFLFEEVRREAGRTELDRARNIYVERYGRYVLYPAVNWPHKNHYRLIEAFNILCQEYGLEDCKLLLTGAPCVEDRVHFYQDLLHAPRSAGRVVHLGFVSAMQLFQLMSGAELMAFPSLYEGFGIPVLEAMRLGAPVIATDLPVFREWVQGCFAPFRDALDPAAMAQDMHRLLTTPAQLGALREAGLARSTEFSSARMARETLDFLDGVLEGAGTRRRVASRDMTSLRRRTHGQAVYVLVETEEQLPAVADALAGLVADPALADIGFVPVMSYSLLGGPASRLLARDPRLAGVQPVYYDPARPEHRGRALRCHAMLTVDAGFHRYLRARALLHIAADPQARASLTLPLAGGAGVDGRYVGRGNWAALRAELKQLASSEPAKLAAALRDNERLSIGDFALADDFVRRTDLDWYGNAMLAEIGLHAAIELAWPRFAVIETELREHIGHHFGLVKSVSQAAMSGGFVPLVGANAASSITGGLAGLEIDACFSSYAIAPEPHVVASQFAEELGAFIRRHELGARDYIYLHMPWSTLVVGILRHVVTQPIEELPTFLIRICSADESFRWHDIRISAVVKAAGELGARRDHIRFFAESAPLQRYFQERSGVDLPVLLNPVSQELVFAAEVTRELRDQRGPRAPVTFGYFGEAREEKGFLLLPGIVEALLASQGPERVAFSLQVSASAQNDTQEVRAARARLVELRDSTANTAGRAPITLHETPFGDMMSYYAALGGCDAMLMPYDPKPYAIRGSGVALEALSVGQPIIVAAGTDMEETFRGPGCLVAAEWTDTAFAASCETFVAHRQSILDALHGYVAQSPLFKHEQDFIRVLTASAPPVPEKRVALWIGNDVLAQGVSAVYASQRDFLRRQGYEIYNVYVPFPDLNGYLHSDAALEKFLCANSLGWAERNFDFGCYAWTLNQRRSEERPAVLGEIADQGASFDRLTRLNEHTAIPTSLQRLIETRHVELVCLNYVHLLPVAEKLGLVGRPGTRVMLETHDIQAYQFALRSDRPIDEEDKERELRRLADVDHAIAISRAEYVEIRENCPWLETSFVVPRVQLDEAWLEGWEPGGTRLRPEAIELYFARGDLQSRFDLRSPASLAEFLRWEFVYGQKESPVLARFAREEADLAARPDPRFPAPNASLGVTCMVGWAWSGRDDVQAAFPQARNPAHADRRRLLDWARAQGLALTVEAQTPPRATNGADMAMEAVMLARPTRLLEPEYRAGLAAWCALKRGADCLVVGSDHPANVMSIRRFIREVFKPTLAPSGVGLLVAGRVANALHGEDLDPAMLLLGDVERLDPLYRAATTVVAPVWAGAGTPIKVLDALARGHCLSTTRFVDAALGLSDWGFPLAANARDMANDISTLLASPEARARRRALARQFAAENLAQDVIDAKLSVAAGLVRPVTIKVPAAAGEAPGRRRAPRREQHKAQLATEAGHLDAGRQD